MYAPAYMKFGGMHLPDFFLGMHEFFENFEFWKIMNFENS